MRIHLQSLFLMLALVAGVHQAAAQGTTAFTYQGQLHDNGTNANGAYTMIFKVYDALTSGNQIGGGITNSVTLANGLFSVNLDFGAGAFTGAARWLDITVSNGVAQTLSPRVQVLPTPYAQYAAVAATVTNGGIMNAQLANNAVALTNIQNGAITNRSLTANAVNATNIASGQIVKTLNGLTDFVILAAGTNVILATNGNTLQISATAGGTNTAAITANADTNLTLIRGIVSDTGVPYSGTPGFNVSHTSTGHYTVTFTKPFSGVPAISLGTSESWGYTVNLDNGVNNQTASAFYIVTETGTSGSTSAIDAAFQFIAVGPR
jgi:hypothetical protein